MNAEGLEVGFSGIPELPAQAQTLQETEVFAAEEPYFWIRDRARELLALPSARQRIQAVTNEIFEEMEEVYKMKPDLLHYRLIFPKKEYAKKITVFEAELL